MAASDLVFTKAGGLTVSECLAMALPMVIARVIPGQEEDNVSYLVRNHAAVQVTNPAAVGAAITKLVNQAGELERMRENCRRIGRPHAAKQVADFVMAQLNAK